ncbi:hypothetical protein HS125_15645 [bacterium]|nr:hypothetical protein [bacterium]
MSAMGRILLFPVRLALALIELLGRTLALLLGLIFFGVGAFLCFLGPLMIVGAPLALLGLILVIKAIG